MLSRYTHAWAWPLDNRLKPAAVISKESPNFQTSETTSSGGLRNPVSYTAIPGPRVLRPDREEVYREEVIRAYNFINSSPSSST
ncbi:hypothetical protein [Luteibaculum oceani]|uniref:Uncharacterized protein n=1 Tax=Luteibaculum oceani TaxID=1294296 RepID=A0A5C6VE90_9FLAO|nr:hypothetical protein [Luteibaculum oceani]TXC81388.1 hypothetical protein FRX97_05120 [Luteibaculum oceani]